jgi:Mor family transcriptional regulator
LDLFIGELKDSLLKRVETDQVKRDMKEEDKLTRKQAEELSEIINVVVEEIRTRKDAEHRYLFARNYLVGISPIFVKGGREFSYQALNEEFNSVEAEKHLKEWQGRIIEEFRKKGLIHRAVSKGQIYEMMGKRGSMLFFEVRRDKELVEHDLISVIDEVSRSMEKQPLKAKAFLSYLELPQSGTEINQLWESYYTAVLPVTLVTPAGNPVSRTSYAEVTLASKRSEEEAKYLKEAGEYARKMVEDSAKKMGIYRGKPASEALC